jgi:rhamnosyltransferase
MKKRVLFFAFHDRHNFIDVHVIKYLEKIRNSFEKIIFVSDQPLKKKELQKIKFVDEYIHENHSEKDFGSWKRGINRIKISDFDELFLTNDSIIGPLINIEKVLNKMDLKKTDFWGISSAGKDNLFHLQSYFLCFNKKCFESKVFKDFFRNIKKLNSKGELVQEYEIGLTQILINSGFKCSYFIEHNDKDIFSSTKSYGLYKNRELPFIKVKVLVSNPVRLPHVNQLLKYIEYNKDIVSYIQRINENSNLSHLFFKLPLFNYYIFSKKFILLSAKITHSKKWWRFYIKIFGIYVFFLILPLKEKKILLYNTYNN